MAESHNDDPALRHRLEEIEYVGRQHGPRLALLVAAIGAAWSLFQLWIASPLPFLLDFAIIVDVPARGIHLAFGMLLTFLVFPAAKRYIDRRLPWYDAALAVLGFLAAFYLFAGYEGLVRRDGIPWVITLPVLGPFPFEAVLGGFGIVLLLEATRRALGLPLVIIASIFLLYSLFGQSMPDVISHKGVSLNRMIAYQWLGGEAIFGIPIDVSVSFVYLFVLFGALLERAGAGRYFLDLSFAMVGRYRGGPAKAAILASGMTGLISGSSIANVVTTGTFTIPVMRRIGLPAVKAGAIEVAASVNGQIMPPIMGAAAFVIAEFLGITYYDVIVAAFIPAFIAYLALLYISHLEALKLGLSGLPRAEIPQFLRTFLDGAHFLAPIVLLIYLLMVERWTPSSSVFYAILAMMLIMLGQRLVPVLRGDGGGIGQALHAGLVDIAAGLVAGARNMTGIAVAVAAAGIIVGVVASTGLNNALVEVVESVSGGNVYILLAMTAALCLVLGLGLPTTANYLVVASLLAGVVVEIGNAAGLVLPLIAVHLYVFYFGLMADVTPPVGLAAYAAAAISRADPIRTGIQAFTYEIRTAILPVVFIFNSELLLIGVESFWHGLMVFVVSLLAIFAFSSITQRWLIVRLRLHEMALLAVACVALFRPDFIMDQIYPRFAPLDMAEFADGVRTVEAGRAVRFHVVRSTNYGDRYKLFVLHTPDPATRKKPRYGPDPGPYGLKLARGDGGRYEVADLAPGGPAEERGMAFGDTVTAIDVEQPGRPAREWVYPIGLALIGLVLALQLGRRRRAAASGEAAP